MKKLLYAVAALGLVIAGYYLYMYWALGNDSVAQPDQPIVGENLDGEADPSRMSLTMTTWRWQNALYNDGREVKPSKPEAFTLKFKNDGTFSATTDCNGAGGNYVATGETLTFSGIVSTLMYCEGSTEGQFLELLTNTSGYHFTSRGELVLDLKFDSGSVVFR
jgi:heat shock protein HslJ